MIGSEAIYNKYTYNTVKTTGYFTPDKRNAEINNGQNIMGATGATQEWSMFSLFAKADYDFKGKYILSATIRRDGSSRFGADNRYGYFPAFSAAWRISDENFMKGISFISDFKLRTSWGQTGNQDIKVTGISDRYSGDYTGYYKSLLSYPISGQQNFSETGAMRVFIRNPKMKWETTTTTDFGMDVALFNNQVTAGIDWYLRKTTDMLEQLMPPTTLGDPTAIPYSEMYYLNKGGTMENKGLDVSFMYRSPVYGNFSWSMGINYSHYKNKVDFVYNTPETYSKGINTKLTGLPFPSFGNSVTQKGSPIASFIGYQIDGIFQDEQEVLNHAKQPRSWNFNVDSDSAYNANASYWVGQWKYLDKDKNGIIDSRDRVILGSPHPDFILGIPINLTYKRFDMNIFLYGVFGHKIFNYTKYYTDLIGNYNYSQKGKRILQSWGMPGVDSTKAVLPEIKIDNPVIEEVSNSYFVEDGSFLRLR